MNMARFLIALLAVSSLAAQVTYEDLVNPDPEDWLTYGRTFDSQRHTPLSEITPENVKDLQVAWIYPITSTTRLQAVPIVVDGVMYVSAPNEVHAIDARTGRNIWTWNRRPAVNRGPERGVAVLGDMVYVSTPDAFLVALDARTGSQIWEAKIAETKDGYYSPSPTFAIDGKIIAGNAAGDYGLNGWLEPKRRSPREPAIMYEVTRLEKLQLRFDDDFDASLVPPGGLEQRVRLEATVVARHVIPLLDMKSFDPERIAETVPEIRRLLVLRWLVSQGRSMIASNSILRNKCKELLPSGEERESSATEDAGGSATPPLEVLRAAVGGLDAHGVFRLRSQETKPAPEQGAGEDAGDDA